MNRSETKVSRENRMVRTFVAVDLASGIRDGIRDFQSELRQCRANLTLVDPRLIHITLKFLGETDDSTLSMVTQALDTIHGEPFTCDVRGVGVNNVRRPRVVWANIHDHGEFQALNAQVESVLCPLGFPREERAYTPHATIARVKEYDPSLSNTIRPHADHAFGDCYVSGFQLKKSTLTPKGPVYETITEVMW